MRPPAFWAGPSDTLPARLLAPLAGLMAAATARRLRRPCFHAPVPVICCGNATLGGAGKTVVALDLAARLRADGRNLHVLLRGYGGTTTGPHRVQPGDAARQVGDEALLLAAVAPTWIGADRAATARAAVADGADLLLLDDGLQNPGLCKDLSLLVIDGGAGFGNGRVVPAGPLREPVVAAAGRCQAAVLIGADQTRAMRLLPPTLPVLHASLVPGPEVTALKGEEVVAFAGIGRPEKFFATLREAGAELIAAVPFPDHHRFRDQEIAALVARAERASARLVTTTKDAARLPPDPRLIIATVTLAWQDPAALAAILRRVIDKPLTSRS